ncbi:MAG: hypothetical protein H6734_28295, partial [Alphaproteobacteria bacterium]|nr:hypothetical protein [Alphaproteobacteria bacterium]
LPGCDTTGYAVFGGDCFPNDASLPLAHDLCYTTADEDCSAAVAVCNLRGVGVPPVTVNRGTTYGLTPRFPTRDGDFDGDGVDDVFVGMQQVQIPTLPDFGLLLYGEAGVPVESWTTQSGVDVSTGMGQHGWTRGVFLDYDGNGQDDLAFLDFDPFSGEELLLWFLQGGSRLPVSTTVEGNVTAGRIHFSAPEASWELKGYDIIAGDLTGPGGLPDGRDDLVVTAPDADAVAGQHDTVYVIEGGGLSFATGASVTFGHASVQRISEPQAPTYYPFDDQLGVDASYVPDIDGAGTPALSLMTMGANDGTEVRVLSGPLLRDGAVTTDITLFNATSPSTGNVNNDAFPRSVWADLDRSGLPDLVFTAPDGTGSRSGSIAVVFDPVLDPAEVGILAIASTTIRSRTDNWEHSSCGEMVAVLPDLLGEESNALVIGCPETQNGGSVWVLDDATLAGGGQLFLEDDAWASIDAGQYNPTIHSLGNTHIVDGGDLDGDGLPDLMMSEGVGPALFHYASGGATYYTGP